MDFIKILNASSGQEVRETATKQLTGDIPIKIEDVFIIPKEPIIKDLKTPYYYNAAITAGHFLTNFADKPDGDAALIDVSGRKHLTAFILRPASSNDIPLKVVTFMPTTNERTTWRMSGILQKITTSSHDCTLYPDPSNIAAGYVSKGASMLMVDVSQYEKVGIFIDAGTLTDNKALRIGYILQ